MTIPSCIYFTVSFIFIFYFTLLFGFFNAKELMADTFLPFFFDRATSLRYTRRTFHCFCLNVSRATLVLNDHLTERGVVSRSRWIPGIRYALPISTARPIYPPWLVWPSRDFPQITKICLPTLTFLAQQISIILMKSGRGSHAKFVWTARTGGLVVCIAVYSAHVRTRFQP